MIELRCDHKKHAELLTEGSGVLEVKCNSRWCGYRKGLSVLHRFDLASGKLVETLKFKDTPPMKERIKDGTNG